MDAPNHALSRAELVHLLQLAYSGELGATLAYLGHRHALRHRSERHALTRIIRDEVHHRHLVLAMLEGLGAGPVARRERKLGWVGFFISVFCHLGGWFWPMFGAGMLEASNVEEYEHAARLALTAGLPELVPTLLELAEVEWDHERVFRAWASSHWLWKIVPQWKAPPPRETIQARFEAYASGPRELVRVYAPWFIR